MIIYLIRNKKNGRLYVGKTVMPLAERWYHHVWRAKNNPQIHCLLHRAIRRYGRASFEVSELARAQTVKQLDALEKHFIKVLNTYPPEKGIGYNLTPGGDGKPKGSKWMPGQREKFIASMKGRFCGNGSPMFGKGVLGKSNGMFGKHISEAAKGKIRAALRPQRLGTANPFFGKSHSNAHRKMMSKRMTGNRNPMFGKDGSENARKSWVTRRRNLSR